MTLDVKPRNPRLYAMLQRMYGKVKISRPGEAFQYRIIGQDGRTSIQRIRGGEEYCVCCPRCKEKRFRLGVNHMFGQYVEGMPLEYSAHCYNCEDNDAISKEVSDNLRTFEECTDLPSVNAVLTDEIPDTNKVAEQCNKEFLKLKGVKRIDEMTMDHPSVRYLVSRKYPVRDLAMYLGVGYCETKEYSMGLANKRIIIPILYNNQYVGWQARVIPEHTKLTKIPGKEGKSWPYKEPKYWTSPGARKSYFLYNYDLAAQASKEIVVVVEGPTDTWRVGLSGVGILGRVISESQIAMLVNQWGGKNIMLIGDPGFETDWVSNMNRIKAKMHVGGSVDLFIGDRDPGDMTTESIWEITRGRLNLQRTVD